MDNSTALSKDDLDVNREVAEDPVSSPEPIRVVEEAVELDIAPTEESFVEDNPMLYIQLGDRVVIDSTRYGRSVG